MLTTFDRHLVRRFLFVFFVFLISIYGLYIVIDVFENVDKFLPRSSGADAPNPLAFLWGPAVYYVYQSSAFFEMAGPILAVVAVIVELAFLQKNSEIKPLLAAGVPTFRLSIPLVLGTVLINVMLVANQEWIIPRISPHLQMSLSEKDDQGERVEPLYDYDADGTLLMHFDGDRIKRNPHRLTHGSITLRPPRLAHQHITIECREALYASGKKVAKAGWLLRGVKSEYDPADLTAEGRARVIPQKGSDDLFIVSDVSFDQLYDRTRGFRYATAGELMRRIRSPTIASASTRGQSLHLHFRVTRPLLNVAMVFACVPLIVRRESLSLIGNMAICAIVMSSMYLIGQACLYLGGTSLIETDLAAWLPVIICGSIAAWLSSYVQT